jgi:cell division transport system permease protein
MFSLKEAFAGFRRARLATFSSIMAMAIVLFFAGLLAVIAYEGLRASQWLRQRAAEVEVFFHDDLASADASRIADQLAGDPIVQSTTFISKEDAQRIFAETFGEDGSAFFDEPFLPASVRMRIRPEHAFTDSLVLFESRMLSVRGVSEVMYNRPVLRTVQDNLIWVQGTVATLALLVIVSALFLVSNTIRLAIASRRRLIQTLMLIGATRGFIRRPFLIEGLLQGLFASMLAALGLAGSYVLLPDRVHELIRLPLYPEATGLLGLIVGMGLAMGWLGAWWSVRRYLRAITLS